MEYGLHAVSLSLEFASSVALSPCLPVSLSLAFLPPLSLELVSFLGSQKFGECVCLCVCVCEREREGHRASERKRGVSVSVCSGIG